MLTSFWIIWGLFALVVLGLFLFRQKIAANENDSVRLAVGEESAIVTQQEIGRKLEVIDKWGKILTVVAGVFFLILFAVQIYALWTASNVAIR